MTRQIRTPARFYRQFDADPALTVPAESYAGWVRDDIDLDLDRIAFVVVHAWDTGDARQYPGWHRAVEYLSRADETAAQVQRVVHAARAGGVRVAHMVSSIYDYYSHLPGYAPASSDGPGAFVEPPSVIEPSASTRALFNFRREHVFPGSHNEDDIARGSALLDFRAGLEPAPGEGIVNSGEGLDRACRQWGTDHLVYLGFTLNGCILIDPGGMNDMQRRGYLCSTVADAVTAIENRETARDERAKELGLWYVALLYGFVFSVDDLLSGIAAAGPVA